MGFLKQLNEFNAQKQRNDQASKQAVKTAQINSQTPVQAVVPQIASIEKPAQIGASQEERRGLADSVVPQVADIKNPYILKKPLTEEEKRANYVQGFSSWADAEKAGDISQQEYANAQIQKMKAEGKNPGEYLNMLSIYGEGETPAQRAKREKREHLGEVFQGLGNLIGSAANMYHASQSGYNIDLNSVNEKHMERMKAIKDKRDALDEKRKTILANAQSKDAEEARKAEAARLEAMRKAREAELKHKRDIEMEGVKHDNDVKLKGVEAEHQKTLEGIRHGNAKEIKNLEHKNSVKLKGVPTYADKLNESNIATSAQGSDGNMYGRRKELSKDERRFLADYAEDLSAHTTVDEDGKETIDWVGAANDALESGKVPYEVLEQMGFKKGKTTNKNYKGASQIAWSDGTGTEKTPKKAINGFGGNKSNKKTISGF